MDSFFYRHIQHIRNGFALIFDIKRFAVIAFPMTYLTWDIDIRQEVHLNFVDAVSAARFTTPAFGIKAKSPFFIAFCLGIWRSGKEVADKIKDTSVSGGI